MVSLSRLTVLVLVVAFTLTLANTLQAQTRTDVIGQAPGVGTPQATPQAQAQTRTDVIGQAPGVGTPQATPPSGVVPYLSVAERYDSNVLYLPTNALQDFVTNVSAGARVNYQGDLGDSTLRAGFISEVYVRNPGLNYIGANGGLIAVLDKAVGKVVRGLGLTLVDNVTYTPQLQSWLTPEVPANSFISGIQAFRNNALTNVFSASSLYALSPSDDLNASYSYQMMRFFDTGSAVPGAIGGLFNTDIHGFTAGVVHHINPLDSIGITYQHQLMSFQPNTGGASSSVTVDGATAPWRKLITRDWYAVLSPGVAVISSLPGELQWTMFASLEWRAPMATATIAYNRAFLPGFYLAGSAMITDGVNLSMTHDLTSNWRVGAQGNYAVSSSIGSANGNLQFDSYGVRGFLNYTFRPGLIASGTATWDHYSYGASSAGTLAVNRQTFVLSLTAEWN